jgi:hypothetical protein
MRTEILFEHGTPDISMHGNRFHSGNRCCHF